MVTDYAFQVDAGVGRTVRVFAETEQELIPIANDSDWTTLMWVRVNNFNDFGQICEFYYYTKQFSINMRIIDGVNQWVVMGTNIDSNDDGQDDLEQIIGSFPYTADYEEWCFFAISSSYNQDIKIHVNGELVSTIAAGGVRAQLLFPYAFGFEQGAEATIDDFNVYDGAMTQEEIQCMYIASCTGEFCANSFSSTGRMVDFDTELFDRFFQSGNPREPSPIAGLPQNSILSDCQDNNQRFIIDTEENTHIVGQDTIDGITSVVDYCWKKADAQTCYEMLGKLDNKGYTKDPITSERFYGDCVNSCRVKMIGGRYNFEILLSYMGDFQPLESCFRQELNFIEQNGISTYNPLIDAVDQDTRIRIPVQPANDNKGAFNLEKRNEWFYSEETNQIYLSMDYEDLQSKGFQMTETKENYQYKGEMELRIMFSSESQFDYHFSIIATLSRGVSQSLDVQVTRNVVYGDCCTNQLQVETSMFICRNPTCTDDQGQDQLLVASDFENETFIVERNEPFHVAMRIDTAEFQHLFLQPLSCTIGPFNPRIETWQFISTMMTKSKNGEPTNIVVMTMRSAVALKNMRIAVTALLDDKNAQNRNEYEDIDGNFGDPFGFNDNTRLRRALEEESETIGTDYKVQAEEFITVEDNQEVEEIETKKGNVRKSNVSNVLGFFVGILSTILAVILL